MRLTKTQEKALRQCAMYEKACGGYDWMPKTMQKLAELGLAEIKGQREWRDFYVLTADGHKVLKEIA